MSSSSNRSVLLFLVALPFVTFVVRPGAPLVAMPGALFVASDRSVRSETRRCFVRSAPKASCHWHPWDDLGPLRVANPLNVRICLGFALASPQSRVFFRDSAKVVMAMRHGFSWQCLPQERPMTVSHKRDLQRMFRKSVAHERPTCAWPARASFQKSVA